MTRWGPVGTCKECGKKCFTSRKDAKAYMKRWQPSRNDYPMSVYQCGIYWHYGHTPWEVARGLRRRGT